MFKNVIAPIQAWLLSQGRCVGCGRSLRQGKRGTGKGKKRKVTCQCGRIYIYEPDKKRYRRALFEEI